MELGQIAEGVDSQGRHDRGRRLRQGLFCCLCVSLCAYCLLCLVVLLLFSLSLVCFAVCFVFCARAFGRFFQTTPQPLKGLHDRGEVLRHEAGQPALADQDDDLGNLYGFGSINRFVDSGIVL